MFLAFNCEAVPKSLVDYEMELIEAEETPTDEDYPSTVLALNSFSKLLGPGLRKFGCNVGTKSATLTSTILTNCQIKSSTVMP